MYDTFAAYSDDGCKVVDTLHLNFPLTVNNSSVMFVSVKCDGCALRFFMDIITFLVHKPPLYWYSWNLIGPENFGAKRSKYYTFLFVSSVTCHYQLGSH